VGLATRKSGGEHGSIAPPVVVLSVGHRIEVQRNFDVQAFECYKPALQTIRVPKKCPLELKIVKRAQ
jgi:hypothetical protein